VEKIAEQEFEFHEELLSKEEIKGEVVINEKEEEEKLGSFEFSVLKDVCYWPGTDTEPMHPQKHFLNIYVPKTKHSKLVNKDGLLPVVVFVHGGGWRRGDRNYWADIYGKVGESYVKHGFVAVVISYRLSPTHPHPRQAIDVARSLRWVKDHIEAFEGDVNRVYLAGHSAGAHLVSLVTLDNRYLAEYNMETSFIKGVAAMCGIYDLNLFAQGGTYLDNAIKGLVFRNIYLHANFGTDSEKWKDASPLHYVHDKAPPFLLLNAAMDFGLEEHTLHFVNAFKEKGKEIRHVVIKGTRHGSLIGLSRLGRGPPAEVTREVIQFLQKLSKVTD